MNDWVSKLIIGMIVVLCALFFVGAVYEIVFRYTHHCVRSHQQFVPAHDDTIYYPDSDGNPIFPVTTHYDDAWETVCDAWEKNP